MPNDDQKVGASRGSGSLIAKKSVPTPSMPSCATLRSDLTSLGQSQSIYRMGKLIE